jgi:hypothetical protein
MHIRKIGANRVARLVATTAVLAAFAAMLVAGGQGVQVAHAAPLPSPPVHITVTHCHITEVDLHGTLPPTTKCLNNSATSAPQPSSLSTTAPAYSSIHVTKGCSLFNFPCLPCDENDNWIYSDASLQGAELCIRGAGQIDLRYFFACLDPHEDWCLNMESWAYIISSFWAGCSSGKMLKDGLGEWFPFGAFDRVTYVGNYWNDQIRYVEQDSGC